jgi:hypothetical protein
MFLENHKNMNTGELLTKLKILLGHLKNLQEALVWKESILKMVV